MTLNGTVPAIMFRGRSFVTFAKAQVSAFTGGVCDYLIMIALTEFAGLHYTLSIIFSGIIGAVINFSINRYWSFSAQHAPGQPLLKQLSRFSLVVAGSVLLKSGGTFLLTTGVNLDYRISRLVVELIVSWGFNYVLQKYWVFRAGANE